MEENRFPITGTVTYIGPTLQVSQYFKKREFKLKFTDNDFTGKIIERSPKFVLINDNCHVFDSVNVEDIVQVQFYIDGRDYVKEGKELNFTSLVCYDVVVISSPQRSTIEDRNAVITNDGLIHQPKEVTIDELIRSGSFLKGEDDPLNKIDLNPKKKEENKSEVKTGDDNPFPEKELIQPKKDEEFTDLPF